MCLKLLTNYSGIIRELNSFAILDRWFFKHLKDFQLSVLNISVKGFAYLLCASVTDRTCLIFCRLSSLRPLCTNQSLRCLNTWEEEPRVTRPGSSGDNREPDSDQRGVAGLSFHMGTGLCSGSWTTLPVVIGPPWTTCKTKLEFVLASPVFFLF